MGELGNLATVLKFGMKLEESSAQFYQEISKDERVTDGKELLKEFAEECDDWKEELHNLYLDCCRSDMDMGALEPVSGVVTEDYTTEKEVSPNMNRANILNIGIEIEEKSNNFYRKIGETIDFLSEKEMKKIAERKEERKEELKTLLK